MQPSLIVVGLSYPASPLAVRERFWLNPADRIDTLVRLRPAEGVEEVAVVVNSERTEFVIWASDLSLAGSSVLSYLTGNHGLRLCEWKNFYRLVDEFAVGHLLRIGTGLDSPFRAGSEILDDLRSALTIAHGAGTAGPHLETAFNGIVEASTRVRTESALRDPCNLPIRAAIDLAREELCGLRGKKIVVLAAERPSDFAERSSYGEIRTLMQLPRQTLNLPEMGNEREALEEMAGADAVILAPPCPPLILSREQIREVALRRSGRPLHMFDLAVPRGIDPAASAEPGIVLRNLDDLHEAWDKADGISSTVERKAPEMLATETKVVMSKMRVAAIPDSIVTYARVREICQEIAHSYSVEVAASAQEAHAIDAVSSRIASRIYNYLAGAQEGRKGTVMDAVRRIYENRHPRTARPEN